ncbi:MAG: DUF2844 domain-containing protein [Stenotrophobium sp.]
MKSAKPLALAAALLAALGSFPVWAVLGGAATSIQSDAAALKSAVTPRTTNHADFTVQRLTLPNGTLVDEYVSVSGTVFALTWHGMRPPDLSQLLGTYFAEYHAAVIAPRPHSRPVQINTGRMTYRAGGHMRSYWGSAQVPALFPADVTAEDIK